MSNELTHHGIIGQKWGVRRFQNSDGSLTSRGRERYGVGEERGSTGDESKETSGKSKRSISEMSDDELNARINRLRMEMQYSELVSKQTTTPEPQKSYVKELFAKHAKRFADQSIEKLVPKLVDKMLGEKQEVTPPFRIDQYKNMDVHAMDGDTIKQVADWYTKAGLITKQRKELSSGK